MFGEFSEKAKPQGGHGRRGVSLLLSVGLFVALGGVVVAAVATSRAIQRHQEDIQVEFASLQPEPEAEPEPEPEPEPEVQPEPSRPRPAAAVSDGPPTSIPDERPQEADGELADAGDTGPVVGDINGVVGGTGDAPVTEPPPPPEPPAGPPRRPRRPPQQERIEVAAPNMISGCRAPERPAGLEGATAETITIYVRIIVGPDGRVVRARIEDSHELIPDELILECIRSRVYEPAHLPDGTAVPYPLRYAFTFRPDVL